MLTALVGVLLTATGGSWTNDWCADGKHIATSPLRWEPGHVFLASSTTVGLMVFDEDIKDFVQRHRYDRINTAVGLIGSSLLAYGIFAACYLSGALLDDRFLKETGALGVQSRLISTSIYLPLKVLTGRSRPYVGEDSRTYRGPTLSAKYHSFPSGHSTGAFTAASLIAHRYENLPVSIVSYGVAALIGWQRLNANVHWASDVLAGGIIGTSIGITIAKLHQ